MTRVLALFAVQIVIPLFCFSQETVELLTTEYEPFCGVRGNTMWCDLVNAAYAREGINVRWLSFPQDREKAMVSAGMNAAFLSGTLVVTRDERPGFIMNDEPMIYASIVAFFPREKFPAGLRLKSPGDLKGNVVGVLLGTGSVNVLGAAGVAIDGAPDKDILMEKLVAGRENFAVIADLVGLYTLQALFPDRVDECQMAHS